ncbi:elongation factor G [candidate division WOR-3 bacterium]|nr:elongation factor G [candidate division WOR-3 bacterium]
MGDLRKIRNIGIIAHIDAGKTTTTERILYYTHRVHKLGEVDEGSATMDWMVEEKERGITITSAVTTCYWKGTRINIVDTPGHIDFTAEVERSLRVLDGAVMVFSAVEGVESQSESVWFQADRYKVPRLVYINKLDRVGANPNRCVNMIKERLRGHPLLVQFPIGSEGSFHGVCDILSEKIIEWRDTEVGSGELEDGMKFEVKDIPESLRARFEATKDDLIETLSLEEDYIAKQYLDGKPISMELLAKAIRKLTLTKRDDDSPRFVPIFFGASLKNIGVQPLLDGIVNYLPSPIDRPPVEGKWEVGSGKWEVRNPDINSPFCALIFKIQSDSHGKLAYLRVYSGKIGSGSLVLNANTDKKERISHIFSMHANKREIIGEATAGNIVAVYGLKESLTGHTLTALNSPMILESLKFPEPVISATIQPKTYKDEEKLSLALNKLSLDDPTFKFGVNSETSETIVSGMGELHLDVSVQRMKREFSLNARLANPRVAYKETFTKVVCERGQFIKQTGGHGQYGDVELEFRPIKKGGGFRFKEMVRGNSIPRQYLPAIRKGIEGAMKVGILAGFPVVDLEAILLDGSYHPIDSSDIAFEMAASIAFKKAMEKGEPVLLEPVMRLEIIVPPEYLGSVIDDLNARGGKILGLSGNKVRHTILSACPLRKLFGYATALRSITQGRVVYIMKFASYQEMAEEEQLSVLKKIRGY